MKKDKNLIRNILRKYILQRNRTHIKNFYKLTYGIFSVDTTTAATTATTTTTMMMTTIIQKH
jgi:hypothetical protein